MRTNETTPILIANASSVPYLSIARITGVVGYNGHTYYYEPNRNILILEDWLKVYRSLPYDQFVEAAKTGIKPTLPKKEKKAKPATPTKTLFD